MKKIVYEVIVGNGIRRTLHQEFSDPNRAIKFVEKWRKMGLRAKAFVATIEGGEVSRKTLA